MKALLIMVFACLSVVAMAQPQADNREAVTFDSPEPTFKVVGTKTPTNQVDRVEFIGAEPQFKTITNTNASATKKPRIEFTSPAPQTQSVNKPKDE